MTPAEVVANLRVFNDWRRGELDDLSMPDPRDIGEAIDAAVEMIERLEAAEKERDNANAAAAGVALQAIELESKLEVAEKTNRGWLRANATGGWIDNLRIENDTLRVKIDQLEEDTKAVILAANSGAQPAPSISPAANPSAIHELLDSLSAAESDALEQARLNGIGAERELALMAKLEAAEKEVEIERMRLAACGVAALGYFEGCAEAYISASLNDVLALRAKIEAMEQQEPVSWADAFGEPFRQKSEIDGVASPLYALPGAQAQNVPKAVAYLDIGAGGYMDIGTDLTDKELDAIPKGRHMLGIVGTYGVDGYVPAQPSPSVPDADELAHFIRRIDGAHGLGASALAEKIVDWLAAAPEVKP